MSRALRLPLPVSLLAFWDLRILPMWSFAALLIFLVQIAVCGIVHDNQNVRLLLQVLNLLPSIFKTALGGDALQVGNAPGLIAIGYNDPLVLFLYMLYAVGVPTILLTGEVQKGTMELILSRPCSKTQVYLCATIIALVGMFTLVLVMFAGTVAGTTMYDFGQRIPLDKFFRLAINGGLMAATAGAVALLAAGVFGGRSAAVGVTLGVLVVQYAIRVISDWWPLASFLKPASLFHYVNGVKLWRGWPLDDMGVLMVVLLVAVVSGGIIWHRRDLPL